MRKNTQSISQYIGSANINIGEFMKNDNPKLSVIVPVYGTERTIR